MSGWYGHTITVNIDESFKFPKIGGKLAFLNPYVNEEVDRLNRKLKFAGSRISYDIALMSQTYQRRAITDLDAVDTGRLRDSVRITGNGLTSHIGTDLFYAETVHDIGYKNQTIFNINGITIRGHSDIGPRPWTEVSAGMVLEKIDGIVDGHLNKIFD